MANDVLEAGGHLLATIFSDEGFFPAAPRSVEETGLSSSLIESLIVKLLGIVGSATGRSIAEHLCLPFRVLEETLGSLRTRQILVHTGSAPLNDYCYTLTDQGRDGVGPAMRACSYIGAAPVPLVDYVTSVDAQTIRAEAPRREQLQKAFADISIDPVLFEDLGPAINSGAGLFLYGAPGNGKSTIARRITMCFGQYVWIPQTLIEDGQLIKLYDSAYHEKCETKKAGCCRPPTTTAAG